MIAVLNSTPTFLYNVPVVKITTLNKTPLWRIFVTGFNKSKDFMNYWGSMCASINRMTLNDTAGKENGICHYRKNTIHYRKNCTENLLPYSCLLSELTDQSYFTIWNICPGYCQNFPEASEALGNYFELLMNRHS